MGESSFPAELFFTDCGFLFCNQEKNFFFKCKKYTMFPTKISNNTQMGTPPKIPPQREPLLTVFPDVFALCVLIHKSS